MLPIGTPVKIKNTLLTGSVKAYELVDEKTKLEYLVAFKGTDGVAHERHFNDAQLEAVQTEVA